MVGVNVGVAHRWRSSLRRLEEFSLRRFARARQGRGGVLYGAEGDYEPVVLKLSGDDVFRDGPRLRDRLAVFTHAGEVKANRLTN